MVTVKVYCLLLLGVNYSKTKIVIFGYRSVNSFRFQLDGNTLEITYSFKYLGIFSKTCTFYKARKHTETPL